MRTLSGLLLLAVSASALAQYVATSPGGASPGTPSTPLSQDFSIVPKHGQTREQQSADLYQCYNWAKSQSGFDPTQVNGGVAPGAVASGREQYRRAMSVCLEARGYEVHYAPPGAPSSAPPASSAATAAVAPPYAPPPPYAVPAPVPVPLAGPSWSAPQLEYHPLSAQIEGGYTATAGTTNNDLDGGGNAGAGLTWFPTSGLPVGVRVDGSYSWFRARPALLAASGDTFGHEGIYGGDADLQLDLAHRSSSYKLYLLGGVGEYREWTDFKQVSLVSGTGCFMFYCGPGQFPAVTAVERSTSAWDFSWNAGFGTEFALGDRTSFFVEARYLRIHVPGGGDLEFVPVRLGLRF